MTDIYRHQLMKLVAIYQGTVNAVEGYEDWILYKVYVCNLGRVVYDDDDKKITIKRGESLTENQLKILDEYLIAESKEVINYFNLLINSSHNLNKDNNESVVNDSKRMH